MSRNFSVRTVFRSVPNLLLKQFFDSMGHSQFDPKWEQLQRSETDPLVDYFTDLPPSQSNVFEQALRSVFDLSSGAGILSLLEAARYEGCESFLHNLPTDFSIYGQAMWARLNYPEVFETATTLFAVEQRSWWRKRNDLPSSKPDSSRDALQKMEREVSSLLKNEGRGRDCTVETFSVRDVDYFFVYPDDFVESVHVHDDAGQLVSIPFRRTFECVLAYDRKQGSLELSAKLKKATKESLEKIFADCILHWELGDHQPDDAYSLDHLLAEIDLPTDPEDGVTAEIVSMELFDRQDSSRLKYANSTANKSESFYELLTQKLDTEAVPLWHWNVTRVAIRFHFLKQGDRKPGRQTIEIGLPHSCSLRNASPDRIDIIQKYLKLWKIDHVPADQTALAAV